MKSILEEFARGNISPNASSFKRDSHYGRTMKTVHDFETKLLSSLSGESKASFEQFSEAQAELNLITGIDRFIYGYRLGVLMTMEVFIGSDEFTSDSKGADA